MTLWYLARAAGLTAVTCLTLATALGALGSGRATGPGRRSLGRRVVLQYTHVAAAITGLLLVLVHVAALVLDSASGISASAAVVPMSSSYRPLAVSLGVLAMYTFVLVSIVGSARGRLAGYAAAARRWRVVHSLAYVGWALAIAHGFLAGTDASRGWVQVLYVGSVCLVGVAVARRLWSQDDYDSSPLPRSRQLVRSLTSGRAR